MKTNEKLLDFITESLESSGMSANLAVADHLRTVASNGDAQATPQALIGEAENLRDAAESVLEMIRDEVGVVAKPKATPGIMKRSTGGTIPTEFSVQRFPAVIPGTGYKLFEVRTVLDDLDNEGSVIDFNPALSEEYGENGYYGIYGIMSDDGDVDDDDHAASHIADRVCLEDALEFVKQLGAATETYSRVDIHKLMDRPIKLTDLHAARQFLTTLAESDGYAYHIDDDPADCIRHADGKPSFKPEVAVLLRDRVSECFMALGYTGAWNCYKPLVIKAQKQQGGDDNEQALPEVSKSKTKKVR